MLKLTYKILFVMMNLSDKGFFAHGVFNLTPGESYELTENHGFILVVVREPYMTNFKMFRVKNLLLCPFSMLTEVYHELPVDKPLIIADSAGLKSRETVFFLDKNGFVNVANMAGGFIEWERDGLPVTVDKEYRLSGSCMCQIKAREGNGHNPKGSGLR